MACPGIGERAAFSDWLRSASIEPVLLVDACLVNTEIAGLRLTAVVADASLLTKEYIADLRKVDGQMPIVAVGDPGDPAERLLTRRGVSFYPRPLDQATFMLAASLAMAEGRPARRSLRRLVPRLPSKIDGASAFLLDVSSEGMRVEVASDSGTRLGPQFQVQVPYSTVGVTVRRVWVRAEGIGDQRRVQCGASLISSDTRALRRLAADAVECAAGRRVVAGGTVDASGGGQSGPGSALRPDGADGGRRAAGGRPLAAVAQPVLTVAGGRRLRIAAPPHRPPVRTLTRACAAG